MKIGTIRDIQETLFVISRNPETFYRDTPMLLKALDDIENINRRIKNIGHSSERRTVKKEL